MKVMHCMHDKCSSESCNDKCRTSLCPGVLSEDKSSAFRDSQRGSSIEISCVSSGFASFWEEEEGKSHQHHHCHLQSCTAICVSALCLVL